MSLRQQNAEEIAKQSKVEIEQQINNLKQQYGHWITNSLQKLNSSYISYKRANITNEIERKKSLVEQAQVIKNIEDKVHETEKQDKFQNDEIINNTKKGFSYFKKELTQEGFDILKIIRKDVYELDLDNKKNEIKELALDIYKNILNIRNSLLGLKEEQETITFVYSLDDNIIKQTTIPLNIFLENLNLDDIYFDVNSFRGFSDMNALKLKNSAIIKMLQDITNTKNPLAKYINENTTIIGTTALYEKRVKKVGKKEQSFVAESMAEASLLNKRYKYDKDSADWYEKQDIFGINKQGILINSSVKSLLGSDSALFGFESLFTILNKLNTYLNNSSSLKSEEILQKIKQEAFNIQLDDEQVVQKAVRKAAKNTMFAAAL